MLARHSHVLAAVLGHILLIVHVESIEVEMALVDEGEAEVVKDDGSTQKVKVIKAEIELDNMKVGINTEMYA